ncbi:DUF7373 family lipoprotein [Nocardia neocaledoniensis]|uniref:Uncharacterized protein n=1 Tax=Nocardia neocaledoniensis TaxID=236511 RepID=A0A317NTE5_9NOCA|nr:hypothetical protein [Nocardia neocaledoniensis]PWV77644.1 hypothetical protein DFR69_103243 [Nocardia neocaledoniensis]
MRTRGMPRRACVALAAALLTVAACGTGDEQAEATDPPVDLASLDVGGYATQPREVGVVANLDQGRFIEAERLGDFVPTPADIDPRFVHTNPSIATVFLDAEASLGKIMAVDRFAETAPDFIGGFVSSAETERQNKGIDMVNAVMIFPDEQKAAAAAVALERADFEYAPNNQPIEIPGYPAAKAHWQPDQQSIGSWFATGHLVIYTWLYDYLKIWLEKVDKQALLDLTRKSLDTIVPSVQKFVPTPSDKLTSLQRDRDGMLGRTAPRPREDSWINPPGVYAGRTARHFTSDPVAMAKIIDSAGVDLYASDGSDVYQARDIAGAQAVRDEIGGLTKKFTRSEAPKNLPFAQCKEYIGRERMAVRFYCAVSYDRYAAYVWSNQLLDAQQRISAQYALLVNAA